MKLSVLSSFFLCLFLGVCGSTAYPAESGYQYPEIVPTDVSFDSQTGEIKYSLPEDALVRLRIGIAKGGPLLRNLLDWEPRKAGSHTEQWDFTDSSGLVSFGKRPDYMLIIACLPTDENKRQSYDSPIRGYRKVPRFEVEFPDADMDNGMAQISGNTDVPVRIMIDARDIKWLNESQFEIGMYLDNTFLMEDEQGVNPFNYELNAKGLSKGRHTLTVNVVGYEGEIGTVSIPFFVK